MITLDNISFKEYIALADKSTYDFAMKYAHRFNIAVDEFKIGEPFKWRYGIVKDIQYSISENDLDFKTALFFFSSNVTILV